MHFQVPQYLDVEDKIIGPLSLKQFVYLLIGGGIIFLLFNFLKLPVFILFALPIAIFTMLLAFYKIGSQKFSQFVVSVLKFLSKPNFYTWKKMPPKKPIEELKTPIIKKAKKQVPEEQGLDQAQWQVEIKQK